MLERYNLLLTLDVRAYWVLVGLYATSLLLHFAHALAHPFYYAKDRALKPEAAERQLFFGQAAVTVLFLTVLLQGGWFLLRSYERGACPIQTRYETYQFFAWIAALTYLFVRRRWAHIYMPGLVVSLVALTAMLCVAASNSLSPDPSPTFPVTKSPWYLWHLGASYFAYGVLAVSFAIELSYVGARIVNAAHLFRSETRPLLDDPRRHKDAYRLALFAFPVLTLGILAGAAWTANVWGALWSWDYLKTASPVTLLLFGIYLHAMHMRRWRGVAASVFNILGFLSVIVVFSGCKFLAGLMGLSSLYLPG